MASTSEIGKWGNSLAVRIPAQLAVQLNIHEGSAVELFSRDHELVVRPAAKRYTLAELLADVTLDTMHGEVGTGEAQGNEEW